MTGLRVWHVNLAAGLGAVDGVLRASTQLAAAQAAQGHDVRLLLVASPAADAVGSTPDAAALLDVRTTTAEAVRAAVAALDDPADRPDVVHLHSVFRPAHARLALALRRTGVPFVTAPHSGLSRPSLRRYPVRKAVYGNLVERRLLRGAAGVACLTTTEAVDARTWARAAALPTYVAPNGLDAAAFTGPRWALPAGDRPLVVTLARYDVRQKGLDVLAELARRCPGIDFAVHGEADHNEPRRTARLLAEAPPNLAFLPPVHGDGKLAVLAGATLFALPSRWEGLSVALAEAMAVGLPCAVSRYVGDSLDVAARGLGLVLDDDPDVAAGQLRAAVADGARLRVWSAAAATWARAELDATVVAERHVAQYRRILGALPPGGDGTAQGTRRRTPIPAGCPDHSEPSSPPPSPSPPAPPH